jgi:uncharacterized repeat protein (TIGR01451 family)
MRVTPSGRSLHSFAVAGGLLTGWLLVSSAAAAQSDGSGVQLGAPVAIGSGALQATIVAEILREEAGADGKTLRSWEPAERLNAGDEVYYTIRVRNPGKQPVTGIVVTKRLPFGMHYKRGSAVGPACEVQFSIDGGTNFAPLERLGAAADGKSSRKVQVSEYTHVRWLLRRPLAPGATALLRFRAIFT